MAQYNPDLTYDAGPTGCGELIMNLFLTMRKMEKGQIIEVVSYDPGAREDLPAWCRMQKHTLLDRQDEGKTRMSQVVREMVDYNIANKVFEKGVRKDMYTVEQDYYQTFISLFTSSWQKTIQKNKRTGRKVYQELTGLKQSGIAEEAVEMKVDKLLEETKKWLDYYEWLERLIEFFDSGEVFNHVPK